MEGDSDLITHETITESSIMDDLRASKHPADDQEDDKDEDNSLNEPEPTSFSALKALKTLDSYFKAQSNSNMLLCKVSKMRHNILAREAFNTLSVVGCFNMSCVCNTQHVTGHIKTS